MCLELSVGLPLIRYYSNHKHPLNSYLLRVRMKHATGKTIFLKDYQQPAFWIDTVNLEFDLFDDHAIVTSTVLYQRNAESTEVDLELFGVAWISPAHRR